MTTNASNGKLWASMVLLAGVGIPGVIIRFSGLHFDPALEALIFGVGIIGAAFLLSWAAEVAQMMCQRRSQLRYLRSLR